MYKRIIYEPENKLRIPGHGTAPRQEVWARPTQNLSPKKYQPEEKTWLSAGSFGDGYQFGDLARGITGTMLETSENVFTGALRVVENAVDAVVGRAANFKPLERPLTEFVTRDLIDEEKIARGYTKYWSLPGWAGMALGVDPDRDSFLGDKGESLAQSAGQLTLTVGANSVGVPGELITGVSSYGSEMESALNAGATPRQANASATISALGELITEKGSGAIKFGGKAWDDVLVDQLIGGVSNKLWKAALRLGVGGVGEGGEEVASEMLSRFGRWFTYQNDETLWEVLFSGEAREAYLDSFLSGFFLGAPAGAVKALLPKSDGSSPKKTQGDPSQDQTTGPNTDVLTQPQVTTPGKDEKPTTASRPGDAPRRALLTQPDTPMDSGVKPGITPDTARGNPDMVTAKTETAPQIQPEAAPEAMPGTDSDIPNITADLRTEADVNTDADSAGTPVSYEDALRDYLGKGTEPSAALNTDADAEPSIPQKAATKSKEQLISELAPKISKPGITPGRATIEAQRLYTEVEQRYGQNAQTVLESYQPGQDPRKYLDGFKNAYLSGKLGDKAALENSTAAAYLSDSQRELAFELGEQAGRGLEKGRNNVRITLEEAVAAADKPYEIPLSREVKKEIIRRGVTSKTTIYTNDTAQNPLATYAQKIPKLEGFYDVVMHGVDTAVWFFDTKIDAYTLSQIIRQRPDYKKGTPIRLLSCSTGNTDNTGDCVAQLLANELEVTVIAPNLKLYVYPDGTYTVGRKNQGEMKEFFTRRVDKYSEVYYGY